MAADEQDPKGRVGKARLGKPKRQDGPRTTFALETPGEAQFDARQARAREVRRKGLTLGEGEASPERSALEAAENATPPTECGEAGE